MKAPSQRILELIGSTAMIALKSNNVTARDNGLSFKFRGSRKGNFLKIEYTDVGVVQVDLYRVSSKLIKEHTESNVAESELHAKLQEILGMKLPSAG